MIGQSDHRAAGNGDARAVRRAVVIGVLATLAVGCIQVHPMELEPADFYAINGCSTPIMAAGSPSKSTFVDWPIINAKPFDPGELDTTASQFDLANVDVNGVFYIWVEPATATYWSVPIEVEFSALRRVESETIAEWFVYEVSGEMCPDH